MLNKLLLFLLLLVLCANIAVAENIIVIDAEVTSNLTLENATSVGRLDGEPDVMVVKYADAFSYQSLVNATSIDRLVGEPDVMVVKYADAFSYQSLVNATSIDRLVGEPNVMVVKYADAFSYQSLKNLTSFCLQDKSLFQVEGQTEVYWHQNNRLYWVTDWNVINDMSGVSGWDSVNTLPASEFDPATYPQGPRFITTGVESNDLLIREQGDIKVHLILNGEKHHFTSPEALTWNGYGFDDVIEVSSTIVGMFPEGTPISIQEKQLLRKPGGTHVFWSQNGELYYVTADALDKMLDIHGWSWDEINEPTDFKPEDPGHYKTFITTDPESNGVLIRLWDGYKVYCIEDGFRRHITYPDVMELKGYAMEDVIDISQDIINMFPLGDSIGIEVNLTFNKTTDSGEETCTKFTTGETVKFYTETTVSESYTVDTYVKLIEPDGRTRYAYYTNPDFQPTDSLSFSDNEVPLYPGHWDAVSKNWNWNEYTFADDEEGVYTWEFYYKDVISGKVLGWDRESYAFAKMTDLGLELTISTNEEVYGENEPIIIFADVHDLSGNDVVVNKDNFEVHLDNFPQEFELEQVCSIHGNYEITGLKAPGPSVIGHKIDVSVKTGEGNAFDTKAIRVGGYTTYTVLMILACPKDLYNDITGKPNVDPWYETSGTPEWFEKVADQTENYYWRVSYNNVLLDFDVSEKWYELPYNNSERYSPVETKGRHIYEDALAEYLNDVGLRDFNYDIVVAVDPTKGRPKWFVQSINQVVIGQSLGAGVYGEERLYVSTPYGEVDGNVSLSSFVGHEITHAITNIEDRTRISDNHSDNHGGPCIMGSGDAGMKPFCPVCGEKLDFSSNDEIQVPNGFFESPLVTTLLSIEGGANRAIHIQPAFMRTYDLIWDPAIFGYRFEQKITEYNYWIEFRDGITWEHVNNRGILIWRSAEQCPEDDKTPPNRDHPNKFWKRNSAEDWKNFVYDPDTDFSLTIDTITDASVQIRIKYNTDVLAIAEKTSPSGYDIEMYMVGGFFEDFPYIFSVIDTFNQSEVFNSTLTTNSNGEFDTPITFNATITDNIEAHPYLIRVHTVSGWVPFLIATPSLIDGISNETPFFTASDPTEKNTAGDLTNLTSTCGSMKLSLKTAMPVDTGSYRYVIYLDSDNSTDTGYIVNSIGADYKIEYSGAGAGLYKYNTSWTLVDTPYLNASHNGTNIEILTTTEIMNGTDTVKLVAQTFDSGDTLYDTLPDPTSTTPYLQFMDVHPMDLRFAEYGYYAGDNVTVNGYGFAQNQMIPIAITNQTNHILWNGSVQADSDGQVINVSTYTVPDDFYGTAYLYWAGAQMDSFSKLTPPLPVYNAEFELDAPMVAGIENEFNVTVSFENIGDDLTNLTLNLNTSGMTSEPEPVWIGDLTSGQNYTYAWNLTPTCSGFALLKAETSSNQSTFTTDQKGIYIANVSAKIDAPNSTQCGSTLEFNVSVTNNQENITYTDLMINTSITDIETNFTQPVIALPPGQTVNQSYLWDTANVTPGTYQIISSIISGGVVLSSGESSILVNSTPFDTTPPSSITNLTPTAGTTWLNFTWTNPPDPDFNHTEIYLNGTFLTNIPAPQNYYNITGLLPNASYELSTCTVDYSGNINQTWVNGTATTKASGDFSGDGITDSWDITYLARSIAGIPGYEVLSSDDISGDGVVNIWDCTYLARAIAGVPGYSV